MTYQPNAAFEAELAAELAAKASVVWAPECGTQMVVKSLHPQHWCHNNPPLLTGFRRQDWCIFGSPEVKKEGEMKFSTKPIKPCEGDAVFEHCKHSARANFKPFSGAPPPPICLYPNCDSKVVCSGATKCGTTGVKPPNPGIKSTAL